MAYSTGTASDIDDLINVKLKAFAIANGWTVNEDNWPTFISLSKGTCFVNFQRYLASGTDPFGYPYTDHRLYARISSGYGPGGFTGQPNVAAYDAIANDLTGPFTSYHFFSGPTVGPQYIHAVIETRAGFYVHIQAGEEVQLSGDTWKFFHYYNKVWVIPDLIEVRNPPIGVPQEFGIWNACLEQNEILNVVEDDTTGLEVSAEAGDVYKRLQLIRYSITLTPLAPIEIDASYIFNFLIGAGELTFKASRAVVLYEPAEAPLKQVYEWKTDVIRAYDGQEQRVLVRPKPRCNLEYKIVFTSDAKIRTQRANLFTSISSPMVFPLWHEAFYLNAQAPQGTRDLYGDFSLRDFRVGDFLLLVSAKNAHSELVKVFFESDDHIILENVLNANFPPGTTAYPCEVAHINDGTKISRFPVNAAQMVVAGKAIELKSLGGRTASLTTFDGLPLLDIRPLNNSLVDDAFTINSEEIDFGNVYNWYGSDAHKTLMLTTADGARQPRKVTSAVDNQDGTTTIIVDTPLPDTVLGSTIASIEYMPKVRLGEDKVTFTHYGAYSKLELNIKTVEE
jgi:hypothetical protein